jgi:hypothetical protein
VTCGALQLELRLGTMTPNKRAADTQPLDGSVPRQKKKAKPAFRLAKDPAVEQIRATTLRQHSYGRLGYKKMATIRTHETAEEPPLAGTFEVEGADFLTGEHDYGIEGASTTVEPQPEPMPAVTPKKRKTETNTTSVSENTYPSSLNNPLTCQQSKLREWLAFRDEFFDELHRIDGRGDYRETTACYNCNKEPGLYRCRDCFGFCLLHCKGCLVMRHKHLPLHRVEVCPVAFLL